MLAGLDIEVNEIRLCLTDLERWALIELCERGLAGFEFASPESVLVADLLGQLRATPSRRYKLASVVSLDA